MKNLRLSIVTVWIFAGVFSSEIGAQEGGPPPTTVAVAHAAALNHADSQSFIGTITAIRISTVGSAVSGRVEKLFFEEGEQVGISSDQSEFDSGPLGVPLAQLRTVTLDLQIAAAQASLKEKQQLLEEIQASIPLEIEQAEAAVAEVEARLEYSKANYERLRQLGARGGGGLSEREIQEAYSTFQSQTNLLVNERAKLALLNATKDSRLAQAQAAVETQTVLGRQLLEQRENYTIRTPFDGYVVKKLTEQGQWIGVGDPIAEVVQLDPIELIVNLPQRYVLELQSSLDAARAAKSSLKAQITIDGVQQIIEGEVAQIVPQADLRSRAFPVRIRIQNPLGESGHLLKPGMLARASLFVGQKRDIVMVPKDALVLGEPILVFAVDEDPTTKKTVVRPIPVTVGSSVKDWIQVDGLVQPGQRVVILGNERLAPGQAVIVTREVDEKPPVDDLNETGSSTQSN